MLIKILIIYLLIINAAAFIFMLVDKIKARKNLWRIPEKVLFLSAILGGSIGSLLGMYLLRHGYAADTGSSNHRCNHHYGIKKPPECIPGDLSL